MARRKLLPVFLAGAATIASLAAARLQAAPRTDGIMPVADIRPGMKGYAVTVFEGTQTDRFEIEVVDTIKNYLPKQDAVLFRATDPRLMHSGIVGGMSGSPIYVEGRLVGALSYGWRFNKDPLGALTPISNMLDVGALPYRPEVLPHPRVGQRPGVKAWSDAMLGLQTSALPARQRPKDTDPTTGLQPLAIPLSISGLSAGATQMIVDAFGMEPVRGGSLGQTSEQPSKPPHRWQPGDSVSVVLVRGDSSVAGNGTVTWVGPKGDRLLAFGHSMFNDGATNVPIADARVHTILASVERSVKLSSPLDIQGLMYQDRQAAIALRTDLRAPMIPMVTTVVGPDRDLAPRTYNNSVAVGMSLTPNLVGAVLAEAVDEAGHDATEVVIHVAHTIGIETTKGSRDIHVDEEIFFPEGVSGRLLAGSRGVILVAAALNNPFEVARIRKIEHKITMEYGAPVEHIEEVRLRNEEVRAGDVAYLEVVLRAFKGEQRHELVPIRIPDDSAGEDIQIELTGGAHVRPYRPIAGDLDDLVTTIEQAYPQRSLVVSLYRAQEGLSTQHGLLPDLPGSILETLSDRSSTRSSVRFKHLARRVLPTPTLIEGEHTVRVTVLPAKSSP